MLSSRENQFLDPQFTVDGGGSERFKVHPLAEATTSRCGVHLLGELGTVTVTGMHPTMAAESC